MEREKLVGIAKVLAIAIIIIILVVFVIVPKLQESEVVSEKNNEGISTEVTFNASDYDSGKVVQDYSNPTEDEKYAINKQYGSNHNYFDEDGLHLVNMTDVIEGEEDKLITDKWPDNEFTRAVLKPDMELSLVEVGETYLKISVDNVKEKDMEKYIEAIEDEYKNELRKIHPNSLYRAYADDGKIVDVKFHEGNAQGVIEYMFDY